MRSIFTADTHIGEYSTGPTINGVNLRIEDVADKMMKILQYAIRNSIKHVFIAGDIFKNKQPSMFCLSIFGSLLKSFQDNGIYVYVITGNHDVYRSIGQAHALSVFKVMKIPNVVIIDEPTGLLIEGVKFLFFPYIASPQDDLLKECLRKPEFQGADVLVMHGSIEGAVVNRYVEYEIHDKDEIKFETISNFKAVFAGHLHQCHQIGHAWYPGSIERLTFDDEGVDKFFLDVTIEGGAVNVKPVELQVRKMMTLRYDQIPEVVAGLINVKDTIVRVMSIEPEYIKDVQRILTEAGCYHIASMQRKFAEHQEAERVVDVKIDIPEFVNKFAKKKKFKGDIPTVTTKIAELLNAQKS